LAEKILHPTANRRSFFVAVRSERGGSEFSLQLLLAALGADKPSTPFADAAAKSEDWIQPVRRRTVNELHPVFLARLDMELGPSTGRSDFFGSRGGAVTYRGCGCHDKHLVGSNFYDIPSRFRWHGSGELFGR